jgi:hypothetical protein
MKPLLEALDTPGGHLALLVLLMLIGIAMEVAKLPKAEDVLVGSFGALLMGLRSQLSKEPK